MTTTPDATPQGKARQLVVLCDGTNNNFTGGKSDTNVAKLHLALSRHPSPGQVLFYDPGVGNAGTLPPVTWTDKLVHYWNRISGLAFGSGVYENIAEGYAFLMNNYQEGDQIFVFGFSRGAFTARAIAGMVNQYGIAAAQMRQMVPTMVMHYFQKSAQHESIGQPKTDYDTLTLQLMEASVPVDRRGVWIQFTGVWDTVESVGFSGFSKTFRRSARVSGNRFLNVRHAMALDEHRHPFALRAFQEPNGSHTGAEQRQVTLRQLWFRGSHCDVGGGNPEQYSSLSRDALMWIADEAGQCGLRLAGKTATVHDWAAAFEPLPADCERQVQSELFATRFWALLGIKPRHAQPAPESSSGWQSAEHPSVANWSASFPADTAWSARRDALKRSKVAWAAALIAAAFVLCALCLSSEQTSVLNAPREFVVWQLTAWVSQDYAATQFTSVGWALLIDAALLIPALAYLLARGSGRAAAKRLGLRRISAAREETWRVIWSFAPLAYVFCDLAENLFSYAVVLSANVSPPSPVCIFAFLMLVFSTLKWLTLGMSIALAAQGWFGKR